jgi:glycosyltransferase involved in cell wall biosynthesis
VGAAACPALRDPQPAVTKREGDFAPPPTLVAADGCATRIVALRHERNQGKGAAIHTALSHVQSEWVLIQDADLEYDPADYAVLLEPIRSGRADVVYGSRFAAHQNRDAAWHTWGNRLLTWASNRVTGLRLTDEATCYKLLRRDTLRAMGLRERGFGFCPEVTAKVARMGLRLVEVPVSYRGRAKADGKKIRLRDGLRALYCLARYGWLWR